jgi:hypothetical protein
MQKALAITRNACRIQFMGSALLTTAPRVLGQEPKMTTFNVTANACEFGLIEAATAQEARDLAAQMAGYKSEADMQAQLEQPSEIVAEEVDA